MIDSLLQWVAGHPGWLLICVFLTAFLESLALAGVIVPGVAVLFGLALVAANTDTSLAALLASATLGAIAGDSLSFQLGRYYREGVRKLWPLSRYPELYQRGETFFSRHGGKSVVVGRFVGPLRPIIPLIAGSLGMKPSRFALFNISSALAWGPFYLLPGYLTGAALSHSDFPLDNAWSVIIATLLASLVGGVIFHQSHRYLNLNLPSNGPRPSTLVAFCAATLFAIWSVLVLYSPWPSQWNESLRHVIPSSSHIIHTPATLVTLLGDPWLLYPLFATFCLWLWIQKHRSEAVVFILGGLLLHACVMAMKEVFGISRPPGTVFPNSFAYPSGHAAGAVYVYGLILTQALPFSDRWFLRGLVALTSGGVFLIASSRLLLDVHWLSDIVGGALLGAALGALAIRIAHQDRNARFGETLTSRNGRRLLVVWLMLAVGYLVWQGDSARERYRKAPAPTLQESDHASLPSVPDASASR